jgi:hypothetical protein
MHNTSLLYYVINLTFTCCNPFPETRPLLLGYGGKTIIHCVEEEHRLRVFENRVLRRIFGPRRDEATEGAENCITSKLTDLYASSNIFRLSKSRRMRLDGHVARMGEKRNEYRLLMAKPEGKTPLGRLRCRCVGNIKTDLREI